MPNDSVRERLARAASTRSAETTQAPTTSGSRPTPAGAGSPPPVKLTLTVDDSLHRAFRQWCLDHRAEGSVVIRALLSSLLEWQPLGARIDEEVQKQPGRRRR